MARPALRPLLLLLLLLLPSPSTAHLRGRIAVAGHPAHRAARHLSVPRKLEQDTIEPLPLCRRSPSTPPSPAVVATLARLSPVGLGFEGFRVSGVRVSGMER